MAESAAPFRGAPKAPRVVLRFARVMVEERGAPSKEVGSVPKVSMGGQLSVWPMGEARGAQCLGARRVREDELISASVMVEVRGARPLGVARALKAALTFARRMVAARDVPGDTVGQVLAGMVAAPATRSLVGRQVFVHFIAA